MRAQNRENGCRIRRGDYRAQKETLQRREIQDQDGRSRNDGGTDPDPSRREHDGRTNRSSHQLPVGIEAP